MALFLDGPSVTVDTLTEYDSNVLSVAASEGINLTTKILLAQESMQLEIIRLLRRGEFCDLTSLWGQARGIEHVVWSTAMRVWQVYRSLGLIYRDAFYSQLNDRHQARAKEYDMLANTARREFVEHGVGLVSLPLRRPPQPVAALVPASEDSGTYYFAASYGSEAGQESAASAVLSVDVADGNAVDLTLGPDSATRASGWNLYAGKAPEQMFRQNDSLIDLSSDWAYLPSSAMTSGAQPGPGQAPDRNWPLHRYLQRG